MTPETARIRYMKLRALADSANGTPEGDNAAAVAARMLEEWGADLAGAGRPELAEDRVFDCRDNYQRDITARVLRFLGLEAYRYRDHAGRLQSGILTSGPGWLLDQVPEMVKVHRAALDRLLRLTVDGYLVAALPYESKLPKRTMPKMTASEQAVAAAAMLAGELNQADKRLPTSRQIEATPQQLPLTPAGGNQ